MFDQQISQATKKWDSYKYLNGLNIVGYLSGWWLTYLHL